MRESATVKDGSTPQGADEVIRNPIAIDIPCIRDRCTQCIPVEARSKIGAIDALVPPEDLQALTIQDEDNPTAMG